jgi:hypothetical protein
VERFTEAMRGSNRLDYKVKVTYSRFPEEEPIEVEGSVAVSRTPGGDFDRFRIEAEGTMPGVGAVDVLMGSTGDAFYVIDRLNGTKAELESMSDSIPFGTLARYALISKLPIGGVPIEERSPASDAADGAIHFVDEVRGEHVYVVFSEQSALPRLIERVVPAPGAVAGVVRTRITSLRIDDADPRKLPRAPPG